MRRSIVGLAIAVPVVLAAEPSHAGGRILVFGDHGARGVAAHELSRLGHHVHAAGALPADLSAYDAVWQVSRSQGLDLEARERLVAFVVGGGGLLLSGELGDEALYLNNAIEAVVNRVIAMEYVEVGGHGLAVGPHQVRRDAPGAIAASPNGLETWAPWGAEMMRGVRPTQIVAHGADERGATIAAWGPDELIPRTGRLVVTMDSDWIVLDPHAPALIENLSRFLVKAPEPDVDLGGSGTDPAAPPDGDGGGTGGEPPVIGATPGEVASGGATTTPAPGTDDLDGDDDDDLAIGGCAAGGGRSSVLFGLAALALVARRRRR